MEWENSSDCVEEYKQFNDCMKMEQRRYNYMPAEQRKNLDLYEYMQNRIIVKKE